MNYFIKKRTAIDVNGTNIGFVTSQTDQEYVHNHNDGNTFQAWFDSNIDDLRNSVKTLADFFTENPSITVVYEMSNVTNYTCQANYPNVVITNLDNPEE